jgi:hypothetical protein
LLFLAGLQNNGCSTELRLLVVVPTPGHTGEREREFLGGHYEQNALIAISLNRIIFSGESADGAEGNIW